MACKRRVLRLLSGLLSVSLCRAIAVPSSAPASAAHLDPSLLSVSLEFFAFPGYTNITGTTQCLDNISRLRGAQPAVRIGGTTQCAITLKVHW